MYSISKMSELSKELLGGLTVPLELTVLDLPAFVSIKRITMTAMKVRGIEYNGIRIVKKL
jgi:hypothetical protein